MMDALSLVSGSATAVVTDPDGNPVDNTVDEEQEEER